MLASCTSEHSAVNYSYEQNRNLRTVVDNNSATGLVSRFEYTYDSAGRRTERLDSLALNNTFAYNVRSELIEAAMDTNEYKYAYDSIGNRQWAQMNAQSNSYVANDLNQYLTNIIDGTTSEILSYDADGNLTNANGWTFSWNGENRLIRASDGTTTVSCVYDYMGRRIRKDVVSDTRDDSAIFIYDGWNLIAELGGMASSPSKTDYYVWGLDLSGSLQGAGGIGGLLAHIPSGDTNTTASAHLAFCDANGNITDYIAIYPDGSGETNGTVIARYQYDPYGNLIEQNGPEADTLRFRFSSKYLESELETATSDGLYYYGLRFYNPNLGRWQSRDPLEEKGGVNLYGFVYNESVGKTDFLGLSVVIIAVKPDFGEEGSSLDWLLLMSGFIDLPWSTIISLVDEMYSTGKEWEDSKWRIDSAYIRHGYEKHEIGSVPDLSPDFLARCDKPNEIIEGRVAGTEKYYYKISYSARYVKRSTSTCIGAWIRHTKYLTTAITKMYQYKTEKLKCICVGGGYQWQKIKGYRLHRKPVEKHWRIRKYDWDGYTIPKLPPGEEWRPEET